MTETTVIGRIAAELGVRDGQVAAAVQLLDGGATVPFIARYRKEATGTLDDAQLRTLEERLRYLRELEERRAAILASITEQGKLTAELAERINAADTKARLEDLYLPYKPKRRTKAQIARENGLEPLADLLLTAPGNDPATAANDYLSDTVPDVQAALDGARAILVERFAEDADLIGALRERMWSQGVLRAQVREGKEDEGRKYSDYFDFAEPFGKLKAHRVLAMFRAEKEEILDLTLDPNADAGGQSYEQPIAERFGVRDRGRPADRWLLDSVTWAWRTRVLVHLGIDLRMRLWQAAEAEAVDVFAANLRDLLLAAPAGQRATMGLDPGFRTGVKVAVIDQTGKVTATHTIYPHVPQHKWDESLAILAHLATEYHVELIAIGNGTASRETDKLAMDLIAANPGLNLTKIVVSEAGASVYSASAYASSELPELDVSLRGAVSIARRLQDPLAELVKIDPKSIGVGQYQHDVTGSKLERSLDAVVEDCVNAVGVDVNTASRPLLSRVSGITDGLAAAIVAHRDASGAFTARQQLMTVPRLGPKAFEQCAGFLRIRGGDDPLDASGVHPESYPVVRRILAKTGTGVAALIGDTTTLRALEPGGVHRRGVRPAHGQRHPEGTGETRPRPAPRVPHGDVRRGRAHPGRPGARHGARGRGDQRRRVRRVRRRRRPPGRPGARVRDVRRLRLRPPLGRQARRRRPREGPVGRHRPPAHLPDDAPGRRCCKIRRLPPWPPPLIIQNGSPRLQTRPRFSSPWRPPRRRPQRAARQGARQAGDGRGPGNDRQRRPAAAAGDGTRPGDRRGAPAATARAPGGRRGPRPDDRRSGPGSDREGARPAGDRRGAPGGDRAGARPDDRRGGPPTDDRPGPGGDDQRSPRPDDRRGPRQGDGRGPRPDDRRGGAAAPASGAMAEALRRAGLLDESGAAKAKPGAAKPHRRDDRP